MYKNFKFKIIKQDSTSSAKLGEIHTPHGIVQTPNIIFCATKAAIKGLNTTQMLEANSQIILSNTYHLMLQPGISVIEKLGGLHKMMNWSKPMFTDSGGYQIFSLGHGSISDEIKGKKMASTRKTLLGISEEGAKFKSYIDGSYHILTPEKSIEVQKALGADLIVVLDECTPYHASKEYTKNSMYMSHRWALRSLEQFKKTDDFTQALYGIVQGGVHGDLRTEGAKFINDHNFFANAVGGSMGVDKSQMHDTVALTMNVLDKTRPTHLLGIGGVSDIFNGVSAGVDTFDCVHPTRLARHGGALVPKFLGLTDKEHINIINAKYRFKDDSIDVTCRCSTCLNYSTGYIHHLFKAREMLGMQLLTSHNVYFMNRLMNIIREAIANDKLNLEQNNWC